MKKRRLILADDHPVVRQGLRGIVARAPGLQVVAESGDGPGAEALARSTPADLLVIDVALPGCSGVQVLQALRRDGITLPVLFYSMVPPQQYAAFLRRAGAQGILGKDADEAQVLQAMLRVLDGGQAFAAGPGAQPPGAPAAGRAVATGALSAREAEVLQGLLQGRPLVAIAQELHIGVASVSTYRRRILDKLDCGSNAELIRLMSG